jgi:hypothetical protein
MQRMVSCSVALISMCSKITRQRRSRRTGATTRLGHPNAGYASLASAAGFTSSVAPPL